MKSLLLVALFLSPALCLRSSVLAEFSCAGDLSVFPNTPMEITASFSSSYLHMANIFFDRSYMRATCTCPSLTRAQFDAILNLGNFEWVVAWMLGGDAMDWSRVCEAAKTAWDVRSWNRTGEAPYFALPSSFTLAGLKSGATQYMKLKVNSSSDVQFGVSVGMCPKKADQLQMPWFQAYTLGTDAAEFGKPCGTCDSPGLSCKKLLGSHGSLLYTPQAIFQRLQDAFFYDQDDVYPGCLSVQTGIAEGLSWVAQSFYLNGQAVDPTDDGAPMLCLPHDFQNINYFSALELGCTNGPTVTCSSVYAYDGKGAPAPPSTTARKYPPIVPRTPGAKVLMSYDCNSSFSILPFSEKLGVRLNFDASPILGLYKSVVGKMQKCRAAARGFTFSEAQFDAFFGLMQTWLAHFVLPAPANPPAAPKMSTVWDAIQRQFFGPLTVVQLPATCTYDSWPKCAISWTGLSTLTGLDITINLLVEECAQCDTSISIYAECVGSGCDVLDFKSCTGPGDSTCPLNSPCVNMWDAYVAKPYPPYPSRATAWFYDWDYQGPCLSTALDRGDFYSAWAYLTGSPPTSINPFGCMVPPVSQYVMQQWLQTQSIVDGNTIRLVGLLPWKI